MALKFRTNLLLSYSVLIALVGTVSALSYYTFRRVSKYSRIVEEEWIEMERITNFDLTLADVTTRLREYRPAAPEKETAEVRKSLSNLKEAYILFGSMVVSAPGESTDPAHEGKEMTSLAELRRLLDGFLREADALLAARSPAAAEEIKGRLDRIASGVRERLSRFIREDRIEIDSAVVRQKEARLFTKTILIWLLAAAIAIAIFLSLIFFFRLVRPVRRLRLGIESIKERDFDHRLEMESDDEIGALAKSFNEMAGNLKQLYQNLEKMVKERTDRLIQAEKLSGIGTLAAGVAHELNNPLATIAACAEGLHDRLPSLERGGREGLSDFQEYLDVIKGETYRCKDIIGTLLDYARKTDFDEQNLELNTVVKEACDLFRYKKDVRGTPLDIALCRESLIVRADPGSLTQVLLNLLGNAVYFSRPGGRVGVETVRRGREAAISITDGGVGIKPRDLKRVFDPFFTTKPRGEGTGLGLALCLSMVERMHGRIEVWSGSVGTRFTIVLPLHEKEA